MKTTILCIILAALTSPVIAQNLDWTREYSLDSGTSRAFSFLFDTSGIVIRRSNDSIQLFDKRGYLIASCALRGPVLSFSPDSTKSYHYENFISIKNHNFQSELEISTKSNAVRTIKFYVNHQLVIAADNDKSYHCINPKHNPRETCSGPPEFARPSCGQPDCIWEVDK